MTVFQDRRDAGRQLARRFDDLLAANDVVVLGASRGGMPVAFEVAIHLAAPLDVLVVRKLGVPGHEELAMGAIASGGVEIADQQTIERFGVTLDGFHAVLAAERAELDRCERQFRGGCSALDVKGKTAVVVDDGLATGASMSVALEALRMRDPARLIAAVPVAPPDVCKALHARANQVICLITPPRMYAVGIWYRNFAQVKDHEVRDLLARATRALPAARSKPSLRSGRGDRWEAELPVPRSRSMPQG